MSEQYLAGHNELQRNFGTFNLRMLLDGFAPNEASGTGNPLVGVLQEQGLQPVELPGFNLVNRPAIVAAIMSGVVTRPEHITERVDFLIGKIGKYTVRGLATKAIRIPGKEGRSSVCLEFDVTTGEFLQVLRLTAARAFNIRPRLNYLPHSTIARPPANRAAALLAQLNREENPVLPTPVILRGPEKIPSDVDVQRRNEYEQAFYDLLGEPKRGSD
jgi:hypothetical protein